MTEAVQELRRTVGESEAGRYSRAGRLDYSWQGLARYRAARRWTNEVRARHEQHPQPARRTTIDSTRWTLAGS